MYNRLHSWPHIMVMFRKFRQCDDGGIAEGNSEAIVRLLADRWETLPVLSELSSQSPAFRRWVLSHLDCTVNAEDLEKIESHAKLNCPGHLENLCQEIRQVIKNSKTC
jgi:hypothetical protein